MLTMQQNTATAMPASPVETTVDEEWATCPALDEAALSGTFWQLFDGDRRTLANFLVLAPQGLLGGFASSSANMWAVVNGRLCLIGENGLPSVVFAAARIIEGTIVGFAGRGTIDGRSNLYVLATTEHPQHPQFSSPPNEERRALFTTQPEGGPLRPNLVIVPAGAGSLHPRWLEDVTSLTRNWDLCIGYYGVEEPAIASVFEYLAHIPSTKKFRLLYNLLYDGSPLWKYEAIWLPDDDLDGTGTDINRMFHIFRQHGLDLAQPALKAGPNSFPTHPITVAQPGSVLRHEPFVEIMCPIFSKRALKICVGSMKDVMSGYGLDHLWPSFLGNPRSRMGIIDAVSFAHTRPIGATYNVQAAVDEQTELFHAYGFTYRRIAGVW